MQEKILAPLRSPEDDSQIDLINKVKGELPLEVQDLDDELAGLKARREYQCRNRGASMPSKQRKREVDQPRYSSAL